MLRATRIAAGAAVVAAIAGFISVYFFYTLTSRQLGEMQAEQRAWVSLDQNPVLTRDLSINENGIDVDLLFVTKNTGKNPAFRSTINLGVDIGRSPSEQWEREVCSQDSSIFGDSVFPGDKSYPRVGTNITPDQIAKAHKDIPPNDRPLDITVIACVVYMDAVTQKWHHTPYAYDIGIRPSDLSKGIYMPLMRALPIKADSLFLGGNILTVMPPD